MGMHKMMADMNISTGPVDVGGDLGSAVGVVAGLIVKANDGNRAVTYFGWHTRTHTYKMWDYIS